MGRRQGRVRERDEQISGAGAGVALRSGAAGRNLRDHVLSLQRDYGNTAVTGVVVQREPKSKPHRTLGAASTNMKDAIKIKPAKGGGKGSKKGEKAPESFFPTKPHVTYGEKYPPTDPDHPNEYKWDLAQLRSEGSKWAATTDRNENWIAVGMLEEVFRRAPALELGLPLSRCYRFLGDKTRAAFWVAVQTRQIPLPSAQK
ncbi:MAG TPA: hypothetical protein VM143_17370 [Acidimicrobiales bacterium]|nr:hypothetical protein [Acidimicrobiales bacterium]